MLVLFDSAGPFWQWKLLDPTYFYLFDSLNLVNLQAPGQLAHPGSTVYLIGAAVVRLMHPLTSGDEIARLVLAAPETYLTAISRTFIVVNALALWVLGIAAYAVFRSPLAVVALQLAPYLSRLILKRGMLVGPETMLIAGTLILMTVVVLALRDNRLAENRTRFAVAFGIAAGLGLATKLTAGPIYILPLILLAAPSAIFVYLLTSIVAFAVFAAPFTVQIASDFPGYINYMLTEAVQVEMSGSSGDGFLSNHLSTMMGLLKRPVMNVPIILSIITLFTVTWARKTGGIGFADIEVRAIIAILAAQLFHAFAVALQPVAFYLIPSYMLSALAVLLVARVTWRSCPETWRQSTRVPVWIGSGLLALLAISSLSGVFKLDEELQQRRAVAAAVDNQAFGTCARIYIFAASSPSYALYLGDRVTGFRFTNRLRSVVSPNEFWIDDWSDQRNVIFRNHAGVQDFKSVASRYSCLYFRGNRPGGIGNFIARNAPDLKLDFSCSTKDENIATFGIGCDGTK